MRKSLNFKCSDIQVKNGFARFLKKYDDVRAKLNSSGFGVEEEKDKTLIMAGMFSVFNHNNNAIKLFLF